MGPALLRGLAAASLLFCGRSNLASFGQTPDLPVLATAPPLVPYKWQNVVIRGGGFVTGLLFHPAQQGLVYARTDVGGAYRSMDAGDHWIPLTDQFGSEEASYLGIESLAVDPSNAKKLYLAAGMYSAEWGGPAAIFRSGDYGSTFEMTPMPFKMGGNDDGRGCGERLAVDPNLGSILYFGSRKAGLWKSEDSGVTWDKVSSFPVQDQVTGPGEKTGITFVVFDRSTGARGNPTKVLYVGVAQAGAGLYRSQDAGATWELVSGAPTTLFPNHAVVNPGRAIYFSYNDNPGPNGIGDGTILRLATGNGKWKDIAPLHPGSPGQAKFGYGGITMDAQHPGTLMVTTIDRWGPGDTVFRTTDSGRHWKDGFAGASLSAVSAPWVYRHHDRITKTHWMNDITIDPFDSAKVIFTSGEGIWGTADVTAMDAGKQPHWGFPDDGLEEVVPIAIVSPPQGAPLLSVVGDLSGFRHEDLQKSPAAGFFTNPVLSSGTGIDFASSHPDVLVRVGAGDAKIVRGGYSQDGGITWKPFATEPLSSSRGSGTVAISTDGGTVVWSPEKGVPSWSTDWGRNWNVCAGLAGNLRVVADRVNPAKFYSFDADSGQFLESLDGARTFALRTEPVASRGRYARIAASPAAEGDLWVAAGDKVYHTDDSGVSFSELRGMTHVYALGFGEPAPGKPQPTIFMDGTVTGTEGIFRSDDDGQSWVRVNDDQHQFGWKNAVIGDPRVYGRVYIATGGRGILYGEPQR